MHKLQRTVRPQLADEKFARKLLWTDRFFSLVKGSQLTERSNDRGGNIVQLYDPISSWWNLLRIRNIAVWIGLSGEHESSTLWIALSHEIQEPKSAAVPHKFE